MATVILCEGCARYGRVGGMGDRGRRSPLSRWRVSDPDPVRELHRAEHRREGRKLAQAIVARGGNSTVVEAIHWHEEWPKARDNGERDPDKLLPNLRALNNLVKRPVVLIDDVITGGGHAVACGRIMRKFGHEVAHVAAAARTVKAPPDGGMFQIPTWDLEAVLFAAC